MSYSRRFAVPLIAVTSNPRSTLAEAAELVLAMPQAKEACPHGLAPTTSTVMQLALGDCLAMALLDSKGFTARDFKALHPGGQLGARLKFVSDLMHKGDRLPLTAADAVMTEAIVVMTEKALGCLGVVDDNGFLKGIITDGDLRRHMGDGLLSKRAHEIMTPAPKTVSPELAGERRAGNDQLVQASPHCSWSRTAGRWASSTSTTCSAPASSNASWSCRAPPGHSRFHPKQKTWMPGTRPA